MTAKKQGAPEDSFELFERAIQESQETPYVLRLYIAGVSPRSNRAVENVKKLCEEYLKGRCDLEVIDIYQHPLLAEGEQIIAAPTLIKKLPPPLRKFIGDMADVEKILLGLDLRPKEKDKPKSKERA